MRLIMAILLPFCFVAIPLFSEEEIFRKRSDLPQKAINQPQSTTNHNAKSNEEPNYQKRRESTRLRINTPKSDSTKTDLQKTMKQTIKKPQVTQDLNQNSPKKESAQSAKKTTSKTKDTEIKNLTNKKKQQLGYRNITIQNIKKQKKISVDFFVGLQFGVDIISMQYITEDDNRNKNIKNSLSGSGSVGLKGGIVSEDDWVGGRFYAEFSYIKYPKFNVMNVGVDLDLLIKYYETPSWKIGGFIGLGGGMNLALIADKTLDNAGKKSLISVGWVNVGLVRFIYYHSTGNHGAELNAKIAYVTPTIYSLKDKNTNITTSYKGNSSTIMMSYVYQF